MSGLARTLCDLPPRLPAAAKDPFAVILLAGPDESLRAFLEYALRASTNANANADIKSARDEIAKITNPASENTPDEITEETEHPDKKSNQPATEDARGIFGFYNTGRRGTAETLALYRADLEKLYTD